jgi:hypothetical protein
MRRDGVSSAKEVFEFLTDLYNQCFVKGSDISVALSSFERFFLLFFDRFRDYIGHSLHFDDILERVYRFITLMNRCFSGLAYFLEYFFVLFDVYYLIPPPLLFFCFQFLFENLLLFLGPSIFFTESVSPHTLFIHPSIPRPPPLLDAGATPIFLWSDGFLSRLLQCVLSLLEIVAGIVESAHSFDGFANDTLKEITALVVYSLDSEIERQGNGGLSLQSLAILKSLVILHKRFKHPLLLALASRYYQYDIIIGELGGDMERLSPYLMKLPRLSPYLFQVGVESKNFYFLTSSS